MAGLTAKQRQVMDLLIEHKTSKEMARLLGISPHTVDQRIQFAKEKLGATSRNEAAAVYRRLTELCGQLTYQDSGIARPASSPETGGGAIGGADSVPAQRERIQPSRALDAERDYPVAPGLFEGRYGTLVRLGTIIVLAVFLVILVLGGLAIFSQLSELMAA